MREEYEKCANTYSVNASHVIRQRYDELVTLNMQIANLEAEKAAG